jgi:hypothetical protein
MSIGFILNPADRFDRHIVIMIVYTLQGADYLSKPDQDTVMHNQVVDMAVSELAEEDDMHAHAKAQTQREEQTKKVGRKLSPLFLRKAEFARWIETKFVAWTSMGQKVTEETDTTKAELVKMYGAVDHDNVPADIKAALEAAVKAMAAWTAGLDKVSMILMEALL